MSTLIGSDLTGEELERIQSVIRAFFVHSSYSELFETRIQKLVFLAEVYCILHYRRRLTRAEYRPYMYGAFSRDVRTALNSMEGIDRRKTVVHGNRTMAYSVSNENGSVDEDIRKIIERVCEYSGDKSTEELAQFSKDSWLFENTDYDHPMRFPEFAEALNEHTDIEDQLRNQMPSRGDIDEEESLLPLTQ